MLFKKSSVRNTRKKRAKRKKGIKGIISFLLFNVVLVLAYDLTFNRHDM